MDFLFYYKTSYVGFPFTASAFSAVGGKNRSTFFPGKETDRRSAKLVTPEEGKNKGQGHDVFCIP
jgi:hypothetical protein